MTTSCSQSKLTVAISLFNYENYIERAIKSVCEQTIANEIELIVVDDASTDNSVNVVNQFQRNNQSLIKSLASFHCEINDQNRGLANARNIAFRMASTTKILVLDADNFLVPQACECLYRALSTAPQSVGAVYPLLAVQSHPYQSIANELPWDPLRFITGNYIDAMALVRQEAWRRVGGYRHTPGGWEDYDFWCRFVECGLEAQQIPKFLGCYQHHQKSMKNTETANRKHELLQLLEKRHPWLKLISPQSI